MDYKEYSAKTVNDCITDACTSLGVPSDKLDYEVISEGSSGFMGIGSKLATIKARIKEESSEVKEENVVEVKKEEVKKAPIKEEPKKEVKASEVKAVEEKKPAKNIDAATVENAKTEAKKFLDEVMVAMKIKAEITCEYDAPDNTLCIDISGDEMGVLIGRRGQTLDSLQYLVSLVINKGTSEYIRVKVDTENYRARRKDTLENLAKNMAFKVKRTRKSVSLEPMNPYERRIIHSALQNDKYVTTHSEGEEPYRKVVVTLK